MENKYFKEALASMAAEAAYVEAVRHLHDIGCSVTEIHKKLSYPVSVDRIEEVIQNYEKEKHGEKSQYEFIQKTDSYGRKSFVKIKKRQ